MCWVHTKTPKCFRCIIAFSLIATLKTIISFSYT